ncbi:MAG: 3-methyl-2-oxobutanoate hydroxymethyltransferase [Acidimicrobiales bacterium]
MVRSRKRAAGAEPLVVVTAYDTPGARIADAAGVDVILVGDSLGDNVLGYDDTLHVTLDDMARHTAAVRRAGPAALVIADLPWMTYHLGVDDAVGNAAALVRAGAQAVKLEGGGPRVAVVEAIVAAQIPVMGHLGLTPQSVLAMGGYRVQARDAGAAVALVDAARALAGAGCFGIVLEGVPDAVAAAVTASVDIPTIGIGAGPACDGQVLVFHDLLGLGGRPPAKFVRRYADLAGTATAAIAAYAADVRAGDFPDDTETYHATAELAASLAASTGEGSPGAGPPVATGAD